METFDSLKSQAEEYYQTPEYLAGVEVIGEIFDQIHGKLVAFDLDMTLVSTPLNDLDDFDLYEETVFFRRPYANEILDIVSKSKNRPMLWTGATLPRVERAKNTAGLILPKNMRVVARDENRLMNIGKINDPASGVKSDSNDGIDDYSSGDDFEEGLIKVPSFLDVDLLIDDLSDVHIASGKRRVTNYADEKKFVKIRPFDLETMVHPSLHRLDFGLLSAVISAGETCGVKTDRGLLDPFIKKYSDETDRHLSFLGRAFNFFAKVF